MIDIINHTQASRTRIYIMELPTFIPAPNIADTRFQLKIPTSPQLILPIATKMNAIIFAINIPQPPNIHSVRNISFFIQKIY